MPWRWREDGQLYYTRQPVEGMGGFLPFVGAADLWLFDDECGVIAFKASLKQAAPPQGASAPQAAPIAAAAPEPSDSDQYKVMMAEARAEAEAFAQAVQRRLDSGRHFGPLVGSEIGAAVQ